MPDNTDDKELIRRCLSLKDRDAWEIFVRKYSRLIWSSVHKTFLSSSFAYTKEDSEDIYNSLFLSLMDNDFKKLRQFRGDNACSVSTWLSVITVRMTIDYMRRDKRRFVMTSGNEERDIWESIPDSKYRADKLIEEKQRSQILEKLTATLSPKDKMMYDLLFNKGFSPEDAARALSLSVSAVYSKKHRIIGKMKRYVEGM